jgi:hypothetical protein
MRKVPGIRSDRGYNVNAPFHSSNKTRSNAVKISKIQGVSRL